jgi:uncharacterized membrane protein YdbT with pleckstrin-like domain
MDKQQLFAIERPHPKLFKLYLIRTAILLMTTGPLAFLLAPVMFFRYHTMRYRFDDEGVSMRWGVFFRQEINLTYARIQDIHLTSGVIQRYLGLADLQIQTASGSATPEMTIEGLLEFEAIRDFLYEKMRGNRKDGGAQSDPAPQAALTEALGELRDELRGAREALERLQPRGGDHV